MHKTGGSNIYNKLLTYAFAAGLVQIAFDLLVLARTGTGEGALGISTEFGSALVTRFVITLVHVCSKNPNTFT